jgi:hypothetical protein
MAQDRMLRASMRWSEKVNEWPIELRYFWTQLWGYCDDYGRGRWDNRLIKADAFPLDDDVNAARVGRWMQGLEQAGVIVGYDVAGRRYFECVNWDEHQEPPYKKRTDVPDRDGHLPNPPKRSRKPQNVPEPSAPKEGEGEREIEREGESASAPTPFCPRHPHGTDRACMPCKRARLDFEAWEKTQKAAPRGHRHVWAADGLCDCGERREAS